MPSLAVAQAGALDTGALPPLFTVPRSPSTLWSRSTLGQTGGDVYVW